ncbi:MAG: hypothetical protein A2Y08_03230 [Planctomycetes bacterium GWA2_40_7]|nr:MAG: hypothetical protein A2Y08_03230 [Planctomycetes bacterium GWA2_40_7]
MKKPRIFIGSSSEALLVAEAIQANLQYDCYCTIWTQGVFGLGKTPIESLISQAEQSDFAILVIHPDDLANLRGKEIHIARDNVIFELGLFIGMIGKNRTVFVIPRNVDVHIPTDLTGLTPASYDPNHHNLQAALGPACIEIKNFIRENASTSPSANKISLFEDFAEDFESHLRKSSSLSVFFIHSRRWREMHNRSIRSFLEKPKSKLIAILPNIKNKSLIERIQLGFSDGPSIPSLILDAYRYFYSLKLDFKRKVAIYSSDFYPTYSFYRFETGCIFAMYPTTPRKKSVPTISALPGGSYFSFVDDDLKYILDNLKQINNPDLIALLDH